jgi:hypothetical protein
MKPPAPPQRSGPQPAPGAAGASLDALRGIISRTRLVILLERMTRAFWPLASFVFAVWSLVAFGLLEVLSRGQIVFGLVLFAAVVLVLYRGA